MRKVVFAGVAAAAALAWAPGARADDASKQKSQGAEQQQGSQSAATPPGRETATGGPDRTSREMRSDARADQSAAKRDDKREPFHGQKNFDVDGRVSHASSGEVTIERKDLPPATLKVAPGTKIEVDGKESSAGQLEPGQEVRASFNLRGGTAEAVELKAKKPSQDDTQKLREERRETQKEMSEKQKQR